MPSIKDLLEIDATYTVAPPCKNVREAEVPTGSGETKSEYAASVIPQLKRPCFSRLCDPIGGLTGTRKHDGGLVQQDRDHSDMA